MSILTAATSTQSENVDLLPFLVLIAVFASAAVVVFLRGRGR